MPDKEYRSVNGSLAELKPTPHLRWRVVVGLGKTLLQRWDAGPVEAFGFTETQSEWREVPLEDEEPF